MASDGIVQKSKSKLQQSLHTCTMLSSVLNTVGCPICSVVTFQYLIRSIVFFNHLTIILLISFSTVYELLGSTLKIVLYLHNFLSGCTKCTVFLVSLPIISLKLITGCCNVRQNRTLKIIHKRLLQFTQHLQF